jgi:hypothetical protein
MGSCEQSWVKLYEDAGVWRRRPDDLPGRYRNSGCWESVVHSRVRDNEHCARQDGVCAKGCATRHLRVIPPLPGADQLVIHFDQRDEADRHMKPLIGEGRDPIYDRIREVPTDLKVLDALEAQELIRIEREALS